MAESMSVKKKHSLVQKFVPIEENLGDIESEIQLRRLEAINKSAESRRRLSAAPLLAGYSSSQLVQHCKDVIKLSTENKINCKNAFNFWLIDVMAAMTKKTDSEINKNFQVASCTLDASVKIYGYRVDAIHTDAIKIAGGFLNKDSSAFEKEGNEECDKNEEVTDKVKVKKKKKKKLTVVPPENLNSKSDSEFMLDVLPQQNFLTIKTSRHDLLNKIPKYDDTGLLLLDSEYPCWPCNGDKKFKVKNDKENVDQESLMSFLSNIRISKDNDLCSFYSNFEFGQNPEQDTDSEEDFQVSQNSEQFEFDINASISEVAIKSDNALENQGDRLNIPIGGVDSDEEILVNTEKPKPFVNLAISDMKSRISVNPSEYSLFDEKVFKAWAGPTHWKVRPARKPLEEFTSNTEEISKPIASKRTRKGKIKSSAGLFEISDDIVTKNLSDCEKTTLFKSTMLNWNPQNTTMPVDLKCKLKNLHSLYHIPAFVVLLKSKEEETTEISDHQDGEEEEVEDMDYCSAPGPQCEEDPQHYTDEDMNLEEMDEAWNLNNMIEVPNKFKKIPVSTFKRRKHVDIRHLKRGLWTFLTKAEEDINEKGGSVEEALEFKELVKLYPGTVSKNVGSSLSVPLIFNALLHLTNEKCLALTQDKANKFNFIITQ